jgi:hypothetical protein
VRRGEGEIAGGGKTAGFVGLVAISGGADHTTRHNSTHAWLMASARAGWGSKHLVLPREEPVVRAHAASRRASRISIRLVCRSRKDGAERSTVGEKGRSRSA